MARSCGLLLLVTSWKRAVASECVEPSWKKFLGNQSLQGIGCVDNSAFQDSSAYTCKYWSETNCHIAVSEFGYTQQEQDEIIAECPEACESCPPCEDNIDFFDAYGYPCSDWENVCTLAVSAWGYTQSEQLQIMRQCPRACGVCTCASPPCFNASAEPFMWQSKELREANQRNNITAYIAPAGWLSPALLGQVLALFAEEVLGVKMELVATLEHSDHHIRMEDWENYCLWCEDRNTQYWDHFEVGYGGEWGQFYAGVRYIDCTGRADCETCDVSELGTGNCLARNSSFTDWSSLDTAQAAGAFEIPVPMTSHFEYLCGDQAASETFMYNVADHPEVATGSPEYIVSQYLEALQSWKAKYGKSDGLTFGKADPYCISYTPAICARQPCIEVMVSELGDFSNIRKNVKLVETLGAPWTLTYARNVEFFLRQRIAAMKSAYRATTFFMWGPNPAIPSDAKRVAVPMGLSSCTDVENGAGYAVGCDRPLYHTQNVVNKSLAAESPELYHLLQKKFRLRSHHIQYMLQLHRAGGGSMDDGKAIACDFMKSHRPLIESWMPECANISGSIPYMSGGSLGTLKCCIGHVTQIPGTDSEICVPKCDDPETETPCVNCGKCVKRCAPGFVLVDGVCKACEPGLVWREFPTASLQTILTGELAGCITCPQGRYSIDLNSTSCAQCSPGKYASEAGATICSPCRAGRYRSGQENPNACILCAVGSYQPNTGAFSCEACPAGAECPQLSSSAVNSTVLYAKAGWWQAGQFTFFQCPLPGACTGDPNEPCAPGMRGPFCNTCKAGWSRSSQRALCSECPSSSQNAIAFALVLCVFAIYVGIMVHLSAESSSEAKEVRYLIPKIFFNYLQMSAIAFRFFHFGTFSGIRDVFKFTDGMTGDPSRVLLSLDCGILDFWSSTDDFFELQLARLGHFLIPVFVIIAIMLAGSIRATYSILCRPNLKQRQTFWVSTLWTRTAIVTAFVVHPVVTDIFIKAVDCSEFDTWRLRTNSLVTCGSMAHFQAEVIAFSGLAVWSLGVPLMFFAMLYRNRRRLLLRKVRRRIGFLFDGFEYQYYYFECVFMLRKVLIIVAASSPLWREEINLLLLLFVGIVFLAVQYWTGPFDNRAYKLLNRLEAKSIWAFVTTILCAFALELDENAQARISHESLRTAVRLIVFLAHLKYWLFMLWVLLRGSIACSSQHCTGKLLVDGDGAIDSGALSSRERSYLNCALSNLMGCMLQTSQVFRVEHFKQLVFIAAVRGVQRATKPEDTAALVDTCDVDTCQVVQPLSSNSALERSLNLSLTESKGLVRSGIKRKLVELKTNDKSEVELLSKATVEAIGLCEVQQLTLKLSVEEFYESLTRIQNNVMSGALVLDPGPDLESWSAAVLKSPFTSKSFSLRIAASQSRSQHPADESTTLRPCSAADEVFQSMISNLAEHAGSSTAFTHKKRCRESSDASAEHGTPASKICFPMSL